MQGEPAAPAYEVAPRTAPVLSADSTIGKIERIQLREVWRREGHDFTR